MNFYKAVFYLISKNVKIAVMVFFTFNLSNEIYSWKAKRHPVNKIRITSTMGETRGDHFHAGIDYADQQPVYPIDKGKIIYKRNYLDNPTIPMTGSGNFIILAVEQNYRVYYLHLKDNSLIKNKKKVNPENVIGTMGNTGRSTGNHLHLTIEDVKKKKIINPLAILPELRDKTKPQIKSFFVRIKNKIYGLKNKSVLNYRGKMELFSVSYDSYTHKTDQGNYIKHYGVKRITLKIDEKIHRDYDFSYFQISPEGLTLFPNYDFFDVCGNPFNIKFGEWVPSRSLHHFTVECEDIAGNYDKKTMAVYFR